MRTHLTLAAAVAATALTLTACGSGSDDAAADSDGVTTLKVGATPVPQADILTFVNDNLAEDAGLEIEVVEYTDYALPNQALVSGDIDANYFQHLPYMEAEVEQRGYELYAFESINIEPFALFSETVDSVDDLPEGAEIGINNDPSNQGRALDLLQEAGLITLNDDVDVTSATIHDVDENPKNVTFVEADAAQLARTLADVDASVINGNNALEAGLSPTQDGILVESAEDNPYGNFLTVRDGEETDENLIALDELLHTDEVRQFIEDTWPDGEVAPAF